MNIARLVVEQELRALGFPDVHTSSEDNLYCPSLDWLREFLLFLKETQPPSRAGVYQCRQNAMYALAQANFSEELSSLVNVGHTFIYAEVMVYPNRFYPADADFPSNHAVCLCRCSDNQWYVFDNSFSLIVPLKDMLDPKNGTLDDGAGVHRPFDKLYWAWV